MQFCIATMAQTKLNEILKNKKISPRIMWSWRLTIYLFIHSFYYMNKSTGFEIITILHLLSTLTETDSTRHCIKLIKSQFFKVGSARPHCISFICPQFWKSLIGSTHLNTVENTALCNDNIIGPEFTQNSFFSMI